MNILVVHNRDINAFPPVKSLVECLINNHHNVTIITRDKNDLLKKYGNKLKVFKLLPYGEKGKLQNIERFVKNRKLIRSLVKREMRHNDVIWTTTDATVREIGPLLFRYKHIMQLMELIDYLPKYPMVPYQSLFKFNIQDYAKKAWKVVVPERNRAYIQKTWWQLTKDPIVLPNKPYSIKTDSELSENIKEFIKIMKNDKRVKVLYQGVFYEDRKLDDFARAIEKRNDKYCLYMMGKKNKYSDMLAKKYPSVRFINFVTPPNHLEITKYADVGILPYLPKKFENNSVLNALYCAPNKIYEYAAFGKPMLGTDVLGLIEPFEKYQMGYALKQLNDDSIIGALQKITRDYNSMSRNALNFFSSTDLDQIIKTILN